MSNAIVTSLFPTEVHDRLTDAIVENNKDNNADSRLKAFLNEDEDRSETLYGAFDEIARRRKVFKVRYVLGCCVVPHNTRVCVSKTKRRKLLAIVTSPFVVFRKRIPAMP